MFVLVPVEVAKHCFLSEAVEYLALGRLPLKNYLWGLDVREDPKDDLYIQLSAYEDCGTSTWESEQRLGLTLTGDPGGHKQRAFLEDHWVKLFNLLHENKLSTRGKRLDDGHSSMPSMPWEVIPSNFWASSKIDWRRNSAEGWNADFYGCVQVVTGDLLRASPLPAPQPAEDIARQGDNYIYQGRGYTKNPLPFKSNRGRPPFDWRRFHVEVTKRFLNEQVPKKQDAFIRDMETWCLDHWGHEVGRSTLQQVIKLYYDSIVWGKNP